MSRFQQTPYVRVRAVVELLLTNVKKRREPLHPES